MKKKYEIPSVRVIDVEIFSVIAASSRSQGDFDPNGKMGDNARQGGLTTGGSISNGSIWDKKW